MKKKFLSIFLVVIAAFSMVACEGKESSTGEGEQEIEYLPDEDVHMAIAVPDNHIGEYIVFTGQVIDEIDVGDEKQAYEVCYEDGLYSVECLVYFPNEIELFADEYIEIDGKILGSKDYKTSSGERKVAPCVDAVSAVEKMMENEE